MRRYAPAATILAALAHCAPVQAQLIDRTKAPNAANEGIAKSYNQEVGAGRGDVNTPASSSFIIQRDPFRAIRRGRQLFQRKYQRLDGSGDYIRDGSGDVGLNNGIGAGSADSCATCHGRPRGSAGFGGDVATRPDSRDAPHLFGLGLKEMLADEITAELRDRRAAAAAAARQNGQPATVELTSKGISYGSITALLDGSFNTSKVQGVDVDLRVRPLFAQGATVSIREFVIGALNNEMGFQCWDPEVAAATKGARMVTPAGMTLDGTLDSIEVPPLIDPSKIADTSPYARNQIDVAIADYLEFYLLNYFKPATYEQTDRTRMGRARFDSVGCASCHIADLTIERDRRVADVETTYDPQSSGLNGLFSRATPLFEEVSDGSAYPTRKVPARKPFVVQNIFTDFKRHDMGPNFYERNYNGTMQRVFMTAALWGVGTTAPYGHDGRSVNLKEVILRHGGDAKEVRDAFAALPVDQQAQLTEFLSSLVLFPPDDTASNLDPGDRNAPDYPQKGHGSIKLTVLFNDPTDIE